MPCPKRMWFWSHRTTNHRIIERPPPPKWASRSPESKERRLFNSAIKITSNLLITITAREPRKGRLELDGCLVISIIHMKYLGNAMSRPGRSVWTCLDGLRLQEPANQTRSKLRSCNTFSLSFSARSAGWLAGCKTGPSSSFYSQR